MTLDFVHARNPSKEFSISRKTLDTGSYTFWRQVLKQANSAWHEACCLVTNVHEVVHTMSQPNEFEANAKGNASGRLVRGRSF
jgi:hypothetical protein